MTDRISSRYKETTQCSTWNIFARDRLFTRTDRADSPILVTRHTVNGHLAGQEGALCLRIVQLTDLHLHPDYPPQKLRRLAALVNAQSPDLIVFTGDFLRHGGLDPLPREDAGERKPGRGPAAGKTEPGGEPDAGEIKTAREPTAEKTGPGRALCGRPRPEGSRRAVRHFPPLPPGTPHEALAILRGMKARYGKFAVRGNHDLRGNPRQVPYYLKKAGFRLLRNEWAVIGLPGGGPASGLTEGSALPGSRKLIIAGLDDGAYHLADPRILLPLKKESGFKLVLAHEPMLARLVPSGAAGLVLAGHTHAGQFRLGGAQRLWMPSLTNKSFWGWRAVNGNPLYVSAGLGESGPGLRILCPAELPVFDCWVR